MDVYALVGQSGTGKSHRALMVAYENYADGIIDDGLLIKDTKILAGYSAKNEQNKIQAVKRAIFSEENHVQEVKYALETGNFNRILILGTSINMVNRIANRLNLPKPSKYIFIEEVASSKEISKARHARLKEGKHIIPVPTMELKPHFSGYLIDPLIVLFKKNKLNRKKLGEKSIVRPAFSYYGKILVEDAALEDIIKLELRENSAVDTVSSLEIMRWDENSSLAIKITLNIIYGKYLPAVGKEIQYTIKDKLEYFTGMYVHNVDIVVDRLIKESNNTMEEI